MEFQDKTISIQPADALDGYTIKSIGFSGVQLPIEIISQLLNGFSSTPGTVTSSDSILSSINKLYSACDRSYSTIHISSGSQGTTNLTAFQRFICVDTSVTGKIINLPDTADPAVIAGCEYIFFVGGGVITSNTITVPSGNYLNNTLNGAYTLSGLLSSWSRIGAISDGSRWFVAS